MEKRPNDLSSRRVRAVPCLIAGAVVRSPHALGLCCLTVAWGRVGRNEPWCRLSLVTAETVTGHCRYCHWSLQVLPLAVKILGFLV